MIRIDQLNLVLPHHLAPRAAEFGRSVGEALARLAATSEGRTGSLDRVRVGPVTVDPGASLEQAARLVAAQVFRALTRRQP